MKKTQPARHALRVLSYKYYETLFMCNLRCNIIYEITTESGNQRKY